MSSRSKEVDECTFQSIKRILMVVGLVSNRTLNSYSSHKFIFKTIRPSLQQRRSEILEEFLFRWTIFSGGWALKSCQKCLQIAADRPYLVLIRQKVAHRQLLPRINKPVVVIAEVVTRFRPNWSSNITELANWIWQIAIWSPFQTVSGPWIRNRFAFLKLIVFFALNNLYST